MAEPRICSIENCDKRHYSLGWCCLHYNRFRAHGDPLVIKNNRGAAADFFANVVMAHEGNECLIWPFSRNADGYAHMSIRGQRSGIVSRYLCKRVHGEPPTSKHDAAHSCGRGRDGCVTKGHLSWKTRAENEEDKILHGTHNRGERAGAAKLTKDDVLLIRSGGSAADHAARLGISKGHVYNIRSGREWAWL